MILAVTVLVAACGSSSPEPDGLVLPTIESEATAITAEELYGDYQNDETAADTKYKGNMIEVSGRVAVIGDIFGALRVLLSTGGMFQTMSVQCIFTEKNDERLFQVVKGDEVTIRGRVEEFKLDVILRDCVLVDWVKKEPED